MLKKLTFMGLLLTTAVVAPFGAMAEEAKEEKSDSPASSALSGSIILGGAVVDLDHKSAKAGEYTGISDSSIYLVGDADLSYDKKNAYIDFRASNIGLDNRNVYLEGGRYGGYKLFLEYDEIPHILSKNSFTPFNGAGGADLTLPAGFVKGLSTASMTTLAGRSVTLDLERRGTAAGFSINLGRDVTLKSSFKRELKTGIKSLGGNVGFFGAAILPEPVDYKTDELRTTLAYKGKTAQAELGYYLSSFTNNIASLAWDNPYDNNPLTSRNSLPPSNNYQKISFSGGVNLPYSSRFSAVAEYGQMRQDETLLPYTNNTVPAATALPRGSADAKINTTHIMLNLASRPLPKLGIDAKYRYYKTVNETPRDLFQYVRYDSGGTNQATTSDAGALYNLPYDYVKNQFNLDASYYVLKATTVKVGYDHDVTGRDYREVAKTTEDTYKIKVTSRAIPFVMAGVDFAHSERGIDGTYDQSRIYDYYHTTTYINSVTPGDRYISNPDLRTFDIAKRSRDKYGAKLTLSGSQNTSVSLNFNRLADEYKDSVLGLTASDYASYGIDFNFSPAESVNVYTFYTKEKLSYDIAGRQFVTGAASVTDPSYNWKATNDNDINTGGIGTAMDFMEKKLVLLADYSYSESNGTVQLTAGSSLPAPAAMPRLRTYMHRLKISGKYRVKENITAGAGYEVESYSSDDWGTAGIDPASGSVANLLALSGATANYEAHKGVVYVSYNF